MKADEETRQALNYLNETVQDLVDSKDAALHRMETELAETIVEREALREAKESLEMDLEHAEREVELLKAKVEELAPSVYGEAA